jgi:hypothetical protein
MNPRPATTLVRSVAYGCSQRPRASVRSCALFFSWLAMATAASGASDGPPGARPADDLLRLVPPDAAVVVTVEGLRDQIHAFTSSHLGTRLLQLPMVKAWFESEKYQQFERSRAQIEALVGANFTELRDELIGDAAVLALRFPPEAIADSSQARGLLLLHARDKGLLDRLINVVNTAQKQGGELAGVADRQRAGVTYQVREFPDPARLPESYVAYEDGTFAFSNSEALIQGVIDRKSRTKPDGGLGDLPRFREVQRLLPEKALARLFVDPRTIERLLAASPHPAKATDANILSLIERYVASVRCAGAALIWGDKSIVLNVVETLEPSKLDPWLQQWAGDTRPAAAAPTSVPDTAVAFAAAHVDFAAVLAAISRIVPEEYQPRLSNFEAVLNGVLMGQDMRTQVLPRLGPGVFAYYDSPAGLDEGKSGGVQTATEPSWPFPLVVVVPLSEDRPAGALSGKSSREEPSRAAVLAALENALHTALAFSALDEKRGQGRSRIATRVVAGASVTTLEPPIPFAYAVDRARSRVILSTSARSVARYLEMPQPPGIADRFRRFQAGAFPADQTFLCVDLDRLVGLGTQHRERLVEHLSARNSRQAGDVAKDLDQVLALSKLFQAVFITSRIDNQATIARQSAGLILHDVSTAEAPRP